MSNSDRVIIDSEIDPVLKQLVFEITGRLLGE
jgi:hypothetical protein